MIFIWHEYIGRIYWISFIGPVAYMIIGFIIVVLYAQNTDCGTQTGITDKESFPRCQ